MCYLEIDYNKHDSPFIKPVLFYCKSIAKQSVGGLMNQTLFLFIKITE